MIEWNAPEDNLELNMFERVLVCSKERGVETGYIIGFNGWWSTSGAKLSSKILAWAYLPPPPYKRLHSIKKDIEHSKHAIQIKKLSPRTNILDCDDGLRNFIGSDSRTSKIGGLDYDVWVCKISNQRWYGKTLKELVHKSGVAYDAGA